MEHEETLPLYTDLPSLVAQDREWRTQSACAENWEPFFDWRRVAEAKDICATCTVREECLNFALANDEREGIWGGLTGKERKAL